MMGSSYNLVEIGGTVNPGRSHRPFSIPIKPSSVLGPGGFRSFACPRRTRGGGGGGHVVMATSPASSPPRKNLKTSNHLRHVDSMKVLPSGAGKLPQLNAIILGEALASDEDDLVFPSVDFSSNALVSSPAEVLRNLDFLFSSISYDCVCVCFFFFLNFRLGAVISMGGCTRGQLTIQLDFGQTLLRISTGRRSGACRSARKTLTSGMEMSR